MPRFSFLQTANYAKLMPCILFLFRHFFCCAVLGDGLSWLQLWATRIKNFKKTCSCTQRSIVCAKNVTCWTLNADRSKTPNDKPQSTCNYANLHAMTRTVVWTPECIVKSAEKLPPIIEDLDSSNNNSSNACIIIFIIMQNKIDYTMQMRRVNIHDND